MVWRAPLVLTAGLLATQGDAATKGLAVQTAFVQPTTLESRLKSVPHSHHGPPLSPRMSAASSSCLFTSRPRRPSALHAASLGLSGVDAPGPSWWQFWKKARAVPPASKAEVMKSITSKEPPVYGALDHSDTYLEACRFLGVSTEIDEEELQQKVQALRDKYKGDRKKQIQINWNSDRILEHRLFMNLHGTMQVTDEVLQAEPNLFNRLEERKHDLLDEDVTKVRNILGWGYGSKGSSGGSSWVSSAQRSPMSNLIRPGFWGGVLGFIKLVLEESFQMPKVKFILYPAGLSYFVNIWWMKVLLDQPRIVAFFAIVASQALWVYGRGKSPTPGLAPGEKGGIKWRRVAAAFVCSTAAALGGYITSVLWVLLGFPIGDLTLDAFTMLWVATAAWIGSGSFFVRDSVLGYLVSRRKNDD